MKALVLLPVLGSVAGASPLLDLGDRNVTGARIRDIAACDADHAITLDDGGWLDRWASGARAGSIDKPRHDILQAIACAGDLVLDARSADVVLSRGDKVIARAKTSGALGGAIIGGRAYFADEHGVYQLPADGWKPWATEGIGLHAIVRPDLVVSSDGSELDWRTRAGGKRVKLPDEIEAIADLGDAIAVADKRGDVYVMTEAKLGAPAFTLQGDPSAIAGDRSWIAVGTRAGTLIQAKRGPGMKPLAAIRVERDRMYETIQAIAIAGDTWLVAGDDQRVHRVARGATTYRAPAIDGHDDSPWAVALDDTWLASAGSDESVRITALDGKPVAVLRPESETGTRPIINVGLTPQLVWARDDYNYLYRWQRKGLKPMPVIANITAVAQLDAKTLLVISKSRLARLELATGALHPIGGKLDFLDAKLAAAGNVAIVAEDAGERPSIVLDATTGARLGTIPNVENASRDGIAVCPDGAVVYADERTVHVWRKGKVVATSELASQVHALACNGRIAIGTWDGTISIRKPDLGGATELANHHGWVLALAWSGHRLASTGADFRVQVTDVP